MALDEGTLDRQMDHEWTIRQGGHAWSGGVPHGSCGVAQLRVAQHQVVQADSRTLAMIGRRSRKHGTQVRHHALQHGTVSDATPCIIPQAGGKWTHRVSCQIRTFVPTRRGGAGASALAVATAVHNAGGRDAVYCRRRSGGGSAGCWSKKRMNSALASGPRGSV